MKILSVFGWSIRIGGHFKSALAHMKRLKVMGHHIYVLEPGGDSAEQMENEFAKNGIEICKFTKSPRWTRLPSYRGTGDIIRVCREKGIDLIQAHDFISFPSCYAAALKLQKGIVFTKPGGPANNLFPPRTIDAIFYSEELLDGMVDKYHLNKDNIAIIRARIDTDIYKPERVADDFMQKYQLTQAEKKIVLATRLDDNKKLLWVDNLLNFAEQTMETNAPARIVIAGEGHLLGDIEKRTLLINRKSKSGPIVRLIGPVFKMKELNQLYNYADIVVGNGRGILEAMACGKPVIIMGDMGEGETVCPENIEDVAFFNFSGRHLLKNGSTPGSLQRALQELFDDTRTCKRLGEYSYNYVKNNMDANLGAEQLIHVYNRCLKKHLLVSEYILWNLNIVFTIIRLAVQRRF